MVAGRRGLSTEWCEYQAVTRNSEVLTASYAAKVATADLR